MNDIAGIPYFVAEFDINGTLQSPVTLPTDVTDVIVMSHGWNNNREDAESLYRGLFTSFSAVGGAPPNRRAAIVGVIWPSKRFDELVAATASSSDGSGAAALHSKASKESDAMLVARLREMASFFTTDTQRATLRELEALIPDLQDKKSAQRSFVEKVRSLLDPSAADKEDASKTFFSDDGAEIMQRLQIDEDDWDDALTEEGGSASLPLGVGVVKPATGGAAGIKGFLSGIKAAAMNVLNFGTYFEMKARAGKVGANGVAPMLDALPAHVQRIHLVGHSFGGRVVTAAAASSTTDRIRSMSLLQTAFSHNGFSKTQKGFFRAVVDKQRVKGPIVVTHSVKDKAVGIAYPMASRISGDTTAALGDKDDKFGGLGRNGAQHMTAEEVSEGKLLPAGSAYQFAAGKFFNLEAAEFIKGHSDITGKEVAHAIRSAMS
jgi:predicted alpha/beta hydrolase family esterase